MLWLVLADDGYVLALQENQQNEFLDICDLEWPGSLFDHPEFFS
jgi:hypothetical protein